MSHQHVSVLEKSSRYVEIDEDCRVLFSRCRDSAEENQAEAQGQPSQPVGAYATQPVGGQIAGQSTSTDATGYASEAAATACPVLTKGQERKILSEIQAKKFRNLELSNYLNNRMFWM